MAKADQKFLPWFCLHALRMEAIEDKYGIVYEALKQYILKLSWISKIIPGDS